MDTEYRLTMRYASSFQRGRRDIGPRSCIRERATGTSGLAIGIAHLASRIPQPASHNAKPATGMSRRVTRIPHPATRDPQPASRIPHPASRISQPASRIPQPATRNPQPASRNPHPASRNPHPATRISQPATRNPHPAANRRRNGVVLVIVLVVIALLALSAYTFSDMMLAEHSAAQVYGDLMQSHEATASGVAMIQAFLRQDPATRNQLGGIYDNPTYFGQQPVSVDEDREFQTLFSVLSTSFDSASYPAGLRYGLENESARLNLNWLLELGEQDRGGAGEGGDGGGDDDGGNDGGSGGANGNSGGGGGGRWWWWWWTTSSKWRRRWKWRWRQWRQR